MVYDIAFFSLKFMHLIRCHLIIDASGSNDNFFVMRILIALLGMAQSNACLVRTCLAIGFSTTFFPVN